MAFARKNFAVIDYDNVTVVHGATITVRREVPTSPLAVLKSDRDGTALANPYVAADGGNAGFFAAGGAYQITATKDGFSRTWRFEPVGLLSERDSIVIRFDPAGADGANYFLGDNVGNTSMLPVGFTYEASDNIIFGKDAGYSLTKGFANIGIGLAVLAGLTIGANNIAIGRVSQAASTTGSNNTSVGVSTLYRNTTGGHNTAIGLQAHYNNTTGSHNTSIGRDSGYSNTTGNWNTNLGVDAGPGTTTGSGNTFVGGEAGYTENLAFQNVTGSNNTQVGYQSGSSSAAQHSNSIAIGYRAKNTASFQAVFGGTDITETILRGNVKPPNIAITGTAGAGFIDLPAQSAGVGAPSSGFRLHTDASERVSFTFITGFIAKFDAIALTATRIYGLPNAAGTLALTAGANIPTVATGDILYGSGANVLSALADVATGNALISGGVGVAPAWGKIALTTHVSGTLPAANGGTGITSLGAGVATWLGAPSSANLAAALTDEDGSGVVPFETTGTWTPTDQSGAGLVFSAVNCRYTRIGNIVHAHGTLTFPATANAAVALIGGLPFTVPNTTYAAVASPVKNTVGITGLLVVPVANSTTFNFWNNGTAANNTNTAMQNSVCSFNISYPVA